MVHQNNFSPIMVENFVNDLISLAKSFGMTIKTTGAESPWSNGLVERHNRVLGKMLDKIIEDSHCSLEVALAWAINAKNSLANVHGFSPYQLVLACCPPSQATCPSIRNRCSKVFDRTPSSSSHCKTGLYSG